MRSLVFLCLALLALLAAGCAASSAGGLIGGGVVDDGEYASDEMDMEMELEAEYSRLDGDEYDEYDAAALDGEWSAEDRPTGPSIGSAIEDHFQNCLDGWSFTMRALGRRISRDSELMFGK